MQADRPSHAGRLPALRGGSALPPKRPLQPAQVAGQAVVAATSALLALGVIMVCAGLLAHAVLTRRRLAGWEADWRATGSQWSKQR